MLKYTLPIVFFYFAKGAFAQSFPLSSLSKAEYNSTQDPLINIIDANGAKQGSWLYVSTTNEVVLKEEYKNNQLVLRYIKNPFNSRWEQLQFASKEIAQLVRVEINAKNVSYNQASNFIIITNGQSTEVYFLGSWEESTISMIREIVVSVILKNNIQKDTYEYIFI